MSISVRVFFVDGDRITRIPTRRFERIWRGDRDATMPEHAGQRVRCAMAYVEVFDRKPVGVLQIDYMILDFDSGGRLDASARERQGRLALESTNKNLPGAFQSPLLRSALTSPSGSTAKVQVEPERRAGADNPRPGAAMKAGFRVQSLRKRISAKTSWKRYVRHFLGFKAPRGWGWLTNPRRAAYNRIYRRTTFGVTPITPCCLQSGSRTCATRT
jgi:hypothetical protein